MPPHIAKVKNLKPLRSKAGMFCVGATSDRRRAASRSQRLARSANRQTKTAERYALQGSRVDALEIVTHLTVQRSQLPFSPAWLRCRLVGSLESSNTHTRFWVTHTQVGRKHR